MRWVRRIALVTLVGAVGAAVYMALTTYVPRMIPATALPSVWSETFDASTLDDHWREVTLSGQTHYEVCEVDGGPSLCATSAATASVLLCKVQVDSTATPWLAWRWRVDELVEGEALDRKEGSDAAARLYIYFDKGKLPWTKRSLNYVWSAALPVGTVLTSAFSKVAKIIVVESGERHLGEWRTVERNLMDDYRRAFGEEPPAVVAVGIMSDSDNTRSRTKAYFDDLRIGRSPQTTSGVSARLPAGPAF